jgi:hypothetical protein
MQIITDANYWRQEKIIGGKRSWYQVDKECDRKATDTWALYVFKMATTLTHEQERMIMSVDYVTNQLVNEKVQTLKRVVYDLVAPSNKKRYIHLIQLMRNFLTKQYDAHATKDDKVSASYC